MRDTFKFRFAGIGIMLAMAAVFGAAVMLLWNTFMPQLFGFPHLSYLEAVGILVLARILFGGLGGGWQGYAAGHLARRDDRLFRGGNRLRQKWMNMSEEERREFIEKERDFGRFNRRFSRMHDLFDDDEKKDTPNE